MYKISEETLNKMLGYLATKPYQEVALLINELQKSERVLGVDLAKTVSNLKKPTNKV